MKTKTVILAGGEGTRLSVLTAKRAKPAVPFAGRYRIIDFALSNCVNSNLFDIMIIAQYRPHSLIRHIGGGGPWDLSREFTGGISIFSPFRSLSADWFSGTADAIQQNFSFVKRDMPDLVLILSGDHIYNMDYSKMIRNHVEKQAEVSLATIYVDPADAHRFGIVDTDQDDRVTSFLEKPENPPSNYANMGIYLFNFDLLDRILWEDHLQEDSQHDFGRNILPKLVNDGTRVFAYPYDGYWVDVGTINSYWQSHMDLLADKPKLNLHDRSWIIHTRSEERSPAHIKTGAFIENSLICDGCEIENGARVTNSVLSPGVKIKTNVEINESIILTDTIIEEGSKIHRGILDKRAHIGRNVMIGDPNSTEVQISMVGMNSIIPENSILEPGAIVGTDVIPSDYLKNIVSTREYIQTRRLPNEV